MTLRKMILFAAGAVALAAPAAASAQSYGQRDYGWRDGQPRGYVQERGDYYANRQGGYGVYPQFRPLEAHIRQEIRQGLQADLLDGDDARDLLRQLQAIQYQELREYRVHGWYLPADDAMRIRSQLDQLDRSVDQIRDEP